MFRNKMPRYEILSEDAMATLDKGWRRLITEIGVEFMDERALELFRRAGQRVEGNTVFLAHVLGWRAEAGALVFMLARTAGWVAHALEENEAEPLRRDYTDLHAHPQAEINVIIPDAQGLEYEIQLYFRRAKQQQITWNDTRTCEDLIAAAVLDESAA